MNRQGRQQLNYGVFLLFFLVVSSAQAQLGFCSGDKGDPIFEEDFGTGMINGPALPAGFTTYTYVPAAPEDGFYTISNNVGQLDSWHLNTPDHTPDDTNGKAFIVNASFTADEFFRRPITGLCENTFYEFSAWLMNLYDRDFGFCPNNGIPVNVRFEIWDETDTNLLASGDTGNIDSTGNPVWDQYGLVFQTASGQETVILKMINNGDGGCGNDLAIDDIAFASCGDTTNITADITTESEFVTCNVNIPVTATFTATPDFSVFSTHVFQWQQSLDQELWTDIPGATTNTYTASAVETTYYRVNVATDVVNLGSPFCSSVSQPFVVEIIPQPVAPVSNGDLTICEDGVITGLSVTGQAREQIRWFDAAAGGNMLATGTSFIPTEAGTFYAEAFVNGSGCSSPNRTAVALAIEDLPVFDVDEEQLSICIDQESVLLDAFLNNVSYVWSTGENTSAISVDTPGEYSVTVTNAAQCSATKRFIVTGIESPIFSDDSFSDVDSVILKTENEGDFEYSLDGSFYQDSNFFQFVPGGVYTAYARNKNGCEITTREFHHLQIPKFFTPNNDGFHDTFSIGGLDFFTSYSVSIFNRYGKLIKSSNGNSFEWNGNYLGQPLPADDYWYYLTIEDSIFQGHFSLKR
ncbi:T9SS type B sorting domain-containing protein [Spongiivirga citrea]|uniref:T9SS type B sorting domain-containing protein n=1 Tax=Spongiivirga citrea TaxID=1481457 RepID=A0A6M0CH86_9FLAO|nr:T9SS type B sorting domain-containing protein [Spongiivirga citrea]NER17298.1 T9SS type B sorting domain-containing protein [Spongiivirga citrea]